MDLGMLQREFAKRIGADIWTIHNWTEEVALGLRTGAVCRMIPRTRRASSPCTAWPTVNALSPALMDRILARALDPRQT